MTNKTSKRQNLLSAANQIVLEQGASRLTLDAVANRAGVSKGGLLYHFPNKNALIAGMIEQNIEDFDNDVEIIRDQFPEQSGQWLKALVTASFDDNISPHVFVAIASAITQKPDLLQPFQDQMNRWIKNAVADGVSLAVAEIVIAATTGAWLERIFWQSSSSEHLKTNLLKMIDDAVKKQGE